MRERVNYVHFDSRDEEILQKLIDLGADCNIEDAERRTVLSVVRTNLQYYHEHSVVDVRRRIIWCRKAQDEI